MSYISTYIQKNRLEEWVDHDSTRTCKKPATASKHIHRHKLCMGPWLSRSRRTHGSISKLVLYFLTFRNCWWGAVKKIWQIFGRIFNPTSRNWRCSWWFNCRFLGHDAWSNFFAGIYNDWMTVYFIKSE